MRIISDFVDYYDCIQGTIFDKDVVYYRKTKVLEEYNRKSISSHGFTYDNFNYFRPQYWNRYSEASYQIIIVGFCDKIYPLFLFYKTTSDNFKPQYDIVTSADLAKEHIDKYKWKKVPRWMHPYQDIDDSWNGITQLIATEKMSEYCLKYNVPIWIRHRFLLQSNPCLKDFSFQKLLHPYEAFQRLYQWFCSKASPEKDIPKISNNDLIEAKGFDLKYSFRKEKQK